MAELLPWHRSQWSGFAEARRQGRSPHALLLQGRAGLGKQRFGALLIQSELCERRGSDGLPCTECRGCRQFMAGSHPDLREIAVESGRMAVRVEQIRALIEFLDLTSQYQGLKIALLPSADRLNAQAANALLKTLEEPAPGSLIVLITDAPIRLPATLRSRCQSIRFWTPDRHLAQAWLQDTAAVDEGVAALALSQGGGSPLTALGLLRPDARAERADLVDGIMEVAHGRSDPLSVAVDWEKKDPELVFSVLCGCYVDLMRLKLSPGSLPLYHLDRHEQLHALANKVNAARLSDCYRSAQQSLELCDTALVKRLMLERALLRLATLFDERNGRDVFA